VGGLTPPAPITEAHQIINFDSGVASLNEWLQRRALKNESSGASRTFVVCEELDIVGYYALAVGSVLRQQAPGKIKRSMPEPIPVMVLGRLAVDQHWQNSGVGSGLLRDALLRTLNVSQQVGIRAILVHALSVEAKNFYLHNGFLLSPLDPMTLLLNLKNILTGT
jgi:GNAT superfamily N-acetyltransferase